MLSHARSIGHGGVLDRRGKTRRELWQRAEGDAARREVENLERRVQALFAELSVQRDEARHRSRQLTLRTRQLSGANRTIERLSVWLGRLDELESEHPSKGIRALSRRLDAYTHRRKIAALHARFSHWRDHFKPIMVPSRGGRVLPEMRRPGSPLRGGAGPTAPVPAPATSRSTEYVVSTIGGLDPPTILVPVHDAYEHLRCCVESVVRNTTVPARLLLIDDASTDPRVSSLLDRYGDVDGVRVLSNEENLGYAATVNRGLRESEGDVVLLNSDTEVTPRWLQNLTLAAHLDPLTATATALSDNAGAFSVPNANSSNELPPGLSRDEVGRLVTHTSDRLYPSSPTGNGFCMYVKRDAIRDVGEFDVEKYPRGYGEENDFCMRARARGWNNVVDDATIVFHGRSASFGSARLELLQAARETTDRLHPEYEALAHAFTTSEPLERVRANVRTAYAERSESDLRPQILFVLHDAGGGTHYTTFDLMDGLADRYSPYLLVSDKSSLKLFRRETSELIELEEHDLQGEWHPTEFSRPDYRAIITNLLVRYRFELVHIRHLSGHTFDLPEIAHSLGTPVVLSFHDFYLSCPTVNLIDDRDEHCGGICTPGIGQCRVPRPYRSELPILKHSWLRTWRHRAEALMEHVDAFVTTSEAARSIYLSSFPRLRGRGIQLIDHGRDLEQAHCAGRPDGGPIRILVPGSVDVHKGSKLLRGLKEIDSAGRLEFHFMGSSAEPLGGLGQYHGPYEREEFNQRVLKIRPSFIGIFSIWPETYCHTLTEAWGAGVPVLGSDMGAIGERIRAHGGGWLIDHRDPVRAYGQILAAAGDSDGYLRELKRATLEGIRSTVEMADDYQALYSEVAKRRRPFGVENLQLEELAEPSRMK